jgi:RNA polymerase sigma-70 factor, ECF subfamily
MRTLALTDEQRAFLERAYRDHGPDLWRAILAFAAGNRDIADDAVAHAFIEAGPRLARIRDPRAWLYAVAFRRAAAELRGARAIEPVGAQTLRQASPRDPMVALVEIADMVDRLSPNQRGVFVLRDVLGYLTAETASLLGISEIAVRVHLHAARRRLRSRMEEAERT